jgi:hypothetical protein
MNLSNEERELEEIKISPDSLKKKKKKPLKN